MRFLIVDDSSTMRRILVNALKSFDYNNFIQAENGKEALEVLKENDVDFIITDWNMPKMNGLEFTQSVRASDKFANTPILMITTRGVKSDIIDALRARVNGYIVKPFTPQMLKDKIDSVTNEIEF